MAFPPRLPDRQARRRRLQAGTLASLALLLALVAAALAAQRLASA